MSSGRKINVEIQRADKGAGRKRARYNSSMMDANLLEKGKDFGELPETWVIFIAENDVIGKGQPLYRIERCILETGENFGDGAHILYVNGAYRDSTPVGKLMHDFSCTDPADMYYDILADRVRFFKERKGISTSYYVLSDIHGCYDDMMQMLKLVDFSEEDTLILAGDYIDRGPKSIEMLQWIAAASDNVILLIGNHEMEFSYEISLMAGMCEKNKWDKNSLEDTRALFLFIKQALGGVFDYYGTIKDLIEIHDCTLAELMKYGSIVGDLPFFHMLEVNNKSFVIVHAGYIESLDGVETERDYETLDDFYIYARDDAYICGGIKHGIVIAGHTPTTLEEELPFNDGDVFMFYDEELDCTFYDIDCGCASRGRIDNAKLACIRLDDEKIFYV